MSEWVIRLIEGGGYWGVAFLMALENIFPPIPSELIMGIGGIAVARGTMTLVPLLIAGTVGATLGNYALFLLADRLGYERLKPFVDRWGRWLTMDWNEVERASHFFRKHGGAVVFFMRFVPMFRTVVSIPAGLSHMSHMRFLLYTAAGAAIWNLVLVQSGRWAGMAFSEAEKYLGWATIAVVAATLVYYFWRVFTWKPTEN
ncbi:DedA family protein [Novosphingobium sp. M1R2S20]|uniref:DedA family protein n=1 Tax=Novosphingobium rhizovicinum TaxID=3228928 RepID=A0ABV3RCV2_9SPHN